MRYRAVLALIVIMASVSEAQAPADTTKKPPAVIIKLTNFGDTLVKKDTIKAKVTPVKKPAGAPRRTSSVVPKTVVPPKLPDSTAIKLKQIEGRLSVMESDASKLRPMSVTHHDSITVLVSNTPTTVISDRSWWQRNREWAGPTFAVLGGSAIYCAVTKCFSNRNEVRIGFSP